MSLSADDAVYATAMLMFATLPIISMRKPRLHHLPPDASSGASPEPARLVAAGAFVLLLWLQVRKEYLLGVSMVAINLVLRLYEIQRHACRVKAMPCRSRATPQAAPCVRGAPTSFRRLLVPEVRWAALLSWPTHSTRAWGVRTTQLCCHRPRPPCFDLLAVDGTASAALEAEPLGGPRSLRRVRRRRLQLHGPRARPRLENRGGAGRYARPRDGPASDRALPRRAADRRHAGRPPCLLRAAHVPDWRRLPCARR